MKRPKLIATDLDHTLLDGEGRVTPRTRQALRDARTAGIVVVPVTARQPIGLRDIAHDAGFDAWALCSNGSFGVHLTTKELLFAEEAKADTLRTVVAALNEVMPGLVYASVRDAGEGFITQEGYAELCEWIDHKRDPREMVGVELDDVLALPSLKLVVRHERHHPTDIYEALTGLGLPGFAVTLSGAPFVEIMAEGVSKATGLARVCEHLSIDQADVIAFGDAKNDMEMLQWAGHGVAVANASPEVLAIADSVTRANTDDGVARMIEQFVH